MKLDEKNLQQKQKNWQVLWVWKNILRKKSTPLLYNVFLGSRFAWRLLQKNKNYPKLIALTMNYSWFPINIYLITFHVICTGIKSNDRFVICTVKTWFKKDLKLQNKLPNETFFIFTTNVFPKSNITWFEKRNIGYLTSVFACAKYCEIKRNVKFTKINLTKSSIFL